MVTTNGTLDLSRANADPWSVEQILTYLDAVEQQGKQEQYSACCPAHDDQKASLRVALGDDGKRLLKCQAGCDYAAIMQALEKRRRDGWTPRQAGPRKRQPFIEETAYDYRDEAGDLLFQVVRGVGKAFLQRRPVGRGWDWSVEGVRKVLYRLPELLAVSPDATVFIVEGEKDADLLWEHGKPATTNPGGALKWLPEFTDWLAEHLPTCRYAILRDEDVPGHKHAAEVLTSLIEARLNARLVILPW
jgi:putative DNA primase/helicase